MKKKSKTSKSSAGPKTPPLSEGWVGASGIALGFYAAYQAPRSPGFVFVTVACLIVAFTLLVHVHHWGEKKASEESVRFLARYVLYLLVGCLSFFAAAVLFGPYVTGVNYPIIF